jgi:tRNA-dihydrouridine synthase C
MRLGFNDDSVAEACALALEAGGASEIVVHARTKADAYRPPAYWPRIADIRAAVKTPLVANGEIWNLQDALRARADSGCHALMLGRGIVANPGLGLTIQAFDAGQQHVALSWAEMLPHLDVFWGHIARRISPRHQAGRFKQWLNFLRRHYPQAEEAYQALRTLSEPQRIEDWLHTHGAHHA